MTTREAIAKALLFQCPINELRDHEALADAVLSGADWETIRDMNELDYYEETSFWLEFQFKALATE
jgi:hypothetical protein